MLVKLSFDKISLFFQSIDWQKPPKDITVSKDISKFIKRCLLLVINQFTILDLLRKSYLYGEKVWVVLHVVDARLVAPNQVLLIAEQAYAESSYKNRHYSRHYYHR